MFGDVDQASDLARNEIFGPVLSILRFRDEDEVVALANDTPYGLAAYVYTRDIARAHRLARALDVGSGHRERVSGARLPPRRSAA